MAAKRSSKIARTARAGSWMALLAATTLGVDGGTVHTEVRASDREIVDGDTYRLVVQSYDGPVSRGGARPIGSFQRVVTGAELKSGVRVNLLELRDSMSAGSREAGRVVAWLEAGSEDLEFDGRRARPVAGSVMGQAPRGDGTVQISLNRKISG